jgi:hypothetical protein
MLKGHAQNNTPVSIRTDTTVQPAGIEACPIGEARKLNEMAFNNWDEHLALFSKVRGSVIKANPNVHIPFDLRVGKQSPLSLFAEAPFGAKPDAIPQGKYALEYQFNHNRSAILTRVVFQDIEGRRYRDVDLKGTGSVSPDETDEHDMARSFVVNVRNPGKFWNVNNYEGLLNRNIALYDYKMTEAFLREGIGTCRVLGIIELHEIIASRPSMTRPWVPRVFTTENIFEIGKYPTPAPERLSLKEAVEEGIIEKDLHPVIEVRAFLTKFRISDISNHTRWGRPMDECGQLMLQDTMKLLSEELELGKVMTKTDYFEWFARAFGHNLGLMHRNGWVHNYLSDGHNITLDGKIVDLDGVCRPEDDNAYTEEFKLMKHATLLRFFERASGWKQYGDDVQPFIDIFEESYDKTFGNGQ